MATKIRDRLLAQRVIPILRLTSAELIERAVDCLADAGFMMVEITLTVPGAIELIGRIACKRAPDFVVGAGTVLNAETAQRCVDAGARFVVSPCVVPGMATIAHAAGCAVLNGGFTPNEVLAAHSEGSDIVKVFPASTGGPEHVRALRAVFPDILLCPTGGISQQNMEQYFAAGAALVGIGNNIVDLDALQAGNTVRATAHARRFLYHHPQSP